MFGYKYYLGYSIERMTASLEEARRTLEPSVIAELTSLDRRIISTKELVSSHKILSPLLEFLEDSTPLDVRFRDFSYSSVDGNLEIRLKGEARSYAVLALQADIFSRSDNFKNPIFSDLTLNDRGEVLFSFQATVDPRLLSYERGLEIQEAQPTPILETSEPEGEASSSPDSLDVSEN